jgi:hypothetical protein
MSVPEEKLMKLFAECLDNLSKEEGELQQVQIEVVRFRIAFLIYR